MKRYVVKDKNSYLINDDSEWSYDINEAQIYDDENDMPYIKQYEKNGYRIVPIKIMEGS